MTSTSCPTRPGLLIRQQGDYIYRMCAPGSDRMHCRMAWEALRDAAWGAKWASQQR